MLLTALLLAAPFGHDHYVSRDGAWCWFADPRAIWVGERILAGSVSQGGDIRLDLYDPKAKTSEQVILAKNFQRDDHDNPSLLPLPDGRVAAFFSKHTGPNMFVSFTKTANQLLDWTEPRKLLLNDPLYRGPQGAINSYTYPNPQILREEDNRIYLFWRGMNWKPTFSFSDDLGRTWSSGKILVSPEGDPTGNRPYTKVAGDGKSRIHVAFTDGHPRNEPTNSIYYVRYERGAIRSSTGRFIANLEDVPITPGQADVVYDGKAEGVRAWIWDVAVAPDGKPVITYSRLPKEDSHYYRYARWDGRRWVDRPIVFGGKWFPQTPEGTTEREPHYSGGAVLDAQDPRFVYLSRPIDGRFEIERWFTPDGGDTWSHVAITGSSKHDSVRPFVIRGQRPDGVGPNALWMNFTKYTHYTDFAGSIQAADEVFGPYSPADPMESANAVWRWVRSNPSPYPKFEWMLAPLYAGVLEYSLWAKNDEATEWVRDQGRANDYRMGPRAAMADDVAVGQAFIGLYELDRDPAQILGVKAWLDGFVAMPHIRGLEWKDGVHNEEMAWCDALFMAPPAMAMLSRVTGDPKYVNRMSELWWKTSDYLYDPAERLYLRDSRYFEPREANGAKVFWSRGNGWVLAGLARVLLNMPANHPDRARFVTQFREMAGRIASLQTADGTWHASLLDPASYPNPETSGTGFFVYAMAWGINAGVLDRAAFEPVVQRGYAALCAAVDPNGRLGWVQPVGQDPRLVKFSDTDTYGVGAFLLASVQVSALTER